MTTMTTTMSMQFYQILHKSMKVFSHFDLPWWLCRTAGLRHGEVLTGPPCDECSNCRCITSADKGTLRLLVSQSLMYCSKIAPCHDHEYTEAKLRVLRSRMHCSKIAPVSLSRMYYTIPFYFQLLTQHKPPEHAKTT
jgi:hypothetical protein